MATKKERLQKLVNSEPFRKGQENGIEFMLYVMAWTLVEGEYFDDVQVQKVLDDMDGFAEDLGKGNLKIKDMMEVLRDEHNITIGFGKRHDKETDN